MRTQTPSTDQVAVFAIASRLLQYPDEELLGCLATIDQAAARLPRSSRDGLRSVVRHLATTPLLELQSAYVDTFDLKGGSCLYLTYLRTGDTRNRGPALWRFGQQYRSRGFSMAGGELPDFLPAVLELAAEAEQGDAGPFELLVGHRPEIAVLRSSLEACGSPYAGVVRALELALPRPDRSVREAARRLAEAGPPEENVGLGPDFGAGMTDALEMEAAAALAAAERGAASRGLERPAAEPPVEARR